MKLLLDANLSWRLVPVLKSHYEDVKHVDQIELSIPPRDEEIWEYAGKNDFVIVTNDQNFIDLVSVKGFPPKVLLLRTGNQSNSFLAQLLIQHLNDITSLYHSTETGLLEMF